jgi:hypothetical protein
MSVFAELGTTDPIEGTAPKGLKSFNAAATIGKPLRERLRQADQQLQNLPMGCS